MSNATLDSALASIEGLRTDLISQLGTTPVAIINVGVNARRGFSKAVARVRRDRYVKFSVVPDTVLGGSSFLNAGGRRMSGDLKFVMPDGATKGAAERLAAAISGETSKGDNTSTFVSFDPEYPNKDI